MRKKLIVVFCCVAVTVAGAGWYVRRHYAIPVLMYHSVRPDAAEGNRLAVSADSFERQMRFLRRRGYRVLPLEELAALMEAGRPVPPRTVVLTFDDGYRDFYTHAFPVLKKYRLPATMFVIYDEVGRPQGDRLSWEQIFEMRDSGLVSFGSHCLGPEPLVNISSEEELRRQIFVSRRKLGEMIGRDVALFSYPEGRFNAKIKQMVKEAGYRLAVATNPGKNFPNDDRFALKRLRISATSDNLLVFWIEGSGYYNFIRERRHK